MTRHETLGAIVARLPELPDDTLASLLGWLERKDDAFERQLRADAEAGRLDALIWFWVGSHDAYDKLTSRL